MPLVVVTGRPCVGKTTVAAALAEFLRREHSEQCANVVLLNDESLGISKRDGYRNAAAEKMSRAALKGAVERACNGSATVIVDALNYIKGYRYELYCIVRATASTHCCVMVDAPLESAREWNGARGDAGYEPAILEDLWTRYETPDEKNRWDAPLFRVDDADVSELCDALRTAAGSAGAALGPTHSESAGGAELGSGLAEGVAKAAAVTSTATAPPNFLHELDRTTTAIVGHLSGMLGLAVAGDVLRVPGSTAPVVLARKVPVVELRRLKRVFDKQAAAAPMPLDAVGRQFVEFINGNLR